MAPSNYHLFGPLKKRYRFVTDQAVKKAVHAWLIAQPEIFLSEGKQKIVQRGTSIVIRYR
jgi:hypothetical protein